MINSVVLKQVLPWHVLDASPVEVDPDKAAVHLAEMLREIQTTRTGRVILNPRASEHEQEKDAIRLELLKLANRMKAMNVDPQSISLARENQPVRFVEALQAMAGQLERTMIIPDEAPRESSTQWRTHVARSTFATMASLWFGDDDSGGYLDWLAVSDAKQANFIGAVLRIFAKESGLGFGAWSTATWRKSRSAYFDKTPGGYRIKGTPIHL